MISLQPVPPPDVDSYKENEDTPCHATLAHQHHAPPQPNGPPHILQQLHSPISQSLSGQQPLSTGQGILSPLPQMGYVRTPAVSAPPRENCPALDLPVIDTVVDLGGGGFEGFDGTPFSG